MCSTKWKSVTTAVQGIIIKTKKKKLLCPELNLYFLPTSSTECDVLNPLTSGLPVDKQITPKQEKVPPHPCVLLSLILTSVFLFSDCRIYITPTLNPVTCHVDLQQYYIGHVFTAFQQDTGQKFEQFECPLCLGSVGIEGSGIYIYTRLVK